MWVKWLRRIEVGDQPWHTREETSKYTDLLANGRARRFTYRHGCQVGHHQPEPAGAAQVTRASTCCPASRGRAAAGSSASTSRSTAAATGRTARIDGPVLDKALTRFYVEFDWDGQEMMIQSRAID